MTEDTPYWKVSQSPVHNHGLFAARFIPKGARILAYTGEKITKAESQRRALAWEESARKRGEGLVYIFELNKRHDIDGNHPDNPARLINHSCQTNCEAVVIRGRIWICAQRDIEEGEELFYDYGYDLQHFLDHPCRCGTPDCVGYIVRKDQRWRLRRMLAKKRKG